MKKVFALILALVMVFAMSSVAFADTITNDTADKTDSSDVTISVVTAAGTSPIYYVVVTWGNLNFQYQKADSGTWQPLTHTYADGKEAGWVAGDNQTGGGESVSATIMIANHSDVAVTASVAAKDTQTNGTAALSLSRVSGEDDTLISAVNAYGNFAGADCITYSATMSGEPTTGNDSSNPFATITVTIAPAP